MGLLEGKVAVITGGTRGLGNAIAHTYAEEGAAVVIASRSKHSVAEAVKSLRAKGANAAGLTADVGVRTQIQALYDHTIDAFGKLDIWINNAVQSSAYGPTIHVPRENFVRTLKTNIFGVYYGSVISTRHFLIHGKGKLINMLGRGDKNPTPYQNAYASSKAWVRSFTLALADEYRDSGVGVFAFNPGLMDTSLLRRIEAVEGYESRLKPLETVIRLWAKSPQQVAQKALWLASSATDHQTGLEIQAMGKLDLLAGLIREGARRLSKDGIQPVKLSITTVPSDFTPHSDTNSS